jgi:outer membrane receptor protein involved in Fe transport
LVSTQTLNEVVITAKIPLLTQEQGKLIVSIENSMLSDAGSIPDMLSRVPGIITNSSGGITVLGKGSPIIYLNNKEINNYDELNALQSTDISKVEIIKNPSAKYSASGRAVIIIKTKKTKGNTTMFQVNDNMTIARKFSNTTGLQINQNINKYSGLYSYSYGEYNQKQYSDQYQTIIHPDYIMNNISDFTQEYKNKSHNIFMGIDYKLNKQHHLGAQFSSRITQNDKTEDRNQSISKTNVDVDEWRQIHLDGKNKANFYGIDLNYRINPDSINTFNIIASYAYQKYNNNNDIDETILSSNRLTNSIINTNNSYNVYSITADYQFNLSNFIITEIGSKIAKIDNNGFSEQYNKTASIQTSFDTNITNEQIYAGYVNLKKDIGNLSLEGGVRYEYSKSTISIPENKNKFTSSNFFPSISIVYVFSDKFDTSLDYSKTIQRQQFSEINPNRIYLDSLSYIIGNPLLKPSFSNYYELGVSLWKDLNITFGYEDISSPTVFIGTNDEKNQDITKFSYINLDKGKYYTLGLIYSLSKGKYNGIVSYNLSIPDFSIDYLNSVHKIKKAMSTISVTNSYTLSNNFSIFCDFRYRGPGEYGIAYWKEQYNLSTGIRSNFFQKRLTISLLFNDILQKNSSGNYDERYNNIFNDMRINQDTRFLRLTIRYNINNINSTLKKRSSNQEELNRL